VVYARRDPGNPWDYEAAICCCRDLYGFPTAAHRHDAPHVGRPLLAPCVEPTFDTSWPVSGGSPGLHELKATARQTFRSRHSPLILYIQTAVPHRQNLSGCGSLNLIISP
jgi:hypothetical protein